MDDVKKVKEKIEFHDFIEDDEQYLMTFEEFSMQTDKNKVKIHPSTQ